MKIVTELRKNEPQIFAENCIVKDIVELDKSEFKSLNSGLMTYQPFIDQRKDLMFKDGDIYHCILALEKESDNGILICSNGTQYAFYFAYIPNARTAVNSHIKELANYIVSEGTEHTENGVWSNSYEELYLHFNAQIELDNGNGQRLLEELKSRPEVKSVSMDDEQVNVIYLHQYCKNIHPEGFIKEGEKGVLENKYNVNLVATYEELLSIPEDEKTTEYFGDLGIHTYKYEVNEEQILPIYKKSIEAIEMDEAEFFANDDLNRYRYEIIARMRDCLLAKTLLTGEEVLFINSEPISGENDFGYKSGFVMSIDSENKTCTINGTYFTMENVPLHNVLGKYNPEVEGMHYGYRNLEPLYDENSSVAQFYIYKSKCDWEIKQSRISEQEKQPLTKKEIEIICAKHTLWLHEVDGGEQADFSNKVIINYDFTGKNLINAVFDKAKIDNCIFNDADISYSSFDGAVLNDCDIENVTANNTSFRNAEILYCDLTGSEFEDCNFSYSKFVDVNKPEAMKGCCIEKVDIDGMDDWPQAIDNCSENEKEWAAEISGMKISIQ